MWHNLKLVREHFAQDHIEKHIPLVHLSMPNISQDSIQHKEEDVKDEELAKTHDHDVFEITTALMTPLFEKESKGNDICSMDIQGEQSFLCTRFVYNSCFFRAPICGTCCYFAFVTR